MTNSIRWKFVQAILTSVFSHHLILGSPSFLDDTRLIWKGWEKSDSATNTGPQVFSYSERAPQSSSDANHSLAYMQPLSEDSTESLSDPFEAYYKASGLSTQLDHGTQDTQANQSDRKRKPSCLSYRQIPSDYFHRQPANEHPHFEHDPKPSKTLAVDSFNSRLVHETSHRVGGQPAQSAQQSRHSYTDEPGKKSSKSDETTSVRQPSSALGRFETSPQLPPSTTLDGPLADASSRQCINFREQKRPASRESVKGSSLSSVPKCNLKRLKRLTQEDQNSGLIKPITGGTGESSKKTAPAQFCIQPEGMSDRSRLHPVVYAELVAIHVRCDQRMRQKGKAAVKKVMGNNLAAKWLGDDGDGNLNGMPMKKQLYSRYGKPWEAANAKSIILNNPDREAQVIAKVIASLEVLLQQIWYFNRVIHRVYNEDKYLHMYGIEQRKLVNWVLRHILSPGRSSWHLSEGRKYSGEELACEKIQRLVVGYLSHEETLETRNFEVRKIDVSVTQSEAVAAEYAIAIMACYYETQDQRKWHHVFESENGLVQFMIEALHYWRGFRINTFKDEKIGLLDDKELFPWDKSWPQDLQLK